MTKNRARVARGIPTGGQFAAQSRSESDVALGPISPKPVEYTLADGTRVRGTGNVPTAPVTDEDGISSYGSSVFRGMVRERKVRRSLRQWLRREPQTVVLEETYHFHGSVLGKDFHLQWNGTADSHQAAWDATERVSRDWALEFDHRPSTLKILDDLDRRAAAETD